jgi:hypothetical protein
VAGGAVSFSPGDCLYFQLWDLTKKSPYVLPDAVKATIGLNSLDGSTIYDKNSRVVEPREELSWGTFGSGGKSNNYACIEFTSQLVSCSGSQSPWGSAYLRSSCLGLLTFLRKIDIEMNFFMKVWFNDEFHLFADDPETIIGSGSDD